MADTEIINPHKKKGKTKENQATEIEDDRWFRLARNYDE